MIDNYQDGIRALSMLRLKQHDIDYEISRNPLNTNVRLKEGRRWIRRTFDAVREELREHLYHKNALEDCGSCGGEHPVGWAGDCRDDLNRF